MALSKKHYEQFAYDFQCQLAETDEAHIKGEYDNTTRILIWERLRATAIQMAVSFALDNPRFNRERFMTACGF